MHYFSLKEPKDAREMTWNPLNRELTPRWIKTKGLDGSGEVRTRADSRPLGIRQCFIPSRVTFF